jgi:selenocysteine lyase/cysteine desulfurase
VSPEEFRSLFPILRDKVYLDSCSQGALATPVEGALRDFVAGWHEHGSPWEIWSQRTEELRTEFAAMIGTDPDEVAITSNASTALNAVASALDLGARRRSKVVTSDFDFPTVSHVWLAQASRGLEVEFARARGEHLPLEAFEVAVDTETALVSTTHVCYRNGWKNDVRALAGLAHAKGALLLVDAFQSMGTEPFAVRELGPDMVVSGVHKYLLGAPGVAFLYVRRDLAEELRPADSGWFGQADPFAYAHRLEYAPGARRFQSGSPQVPAVCAGLAALRLLREVGLAAVRDHVGRLTDQLIAAAKDQGWRLLTPERPDRRGPLVALEATDALALAARLAQRDVICSARDGALRVSFHYYNSAQDVSALVDALVKHRGLLAGS